MSIQINLGVLTALFETCLIRDKLKALTAQRKLLKSIQNPNCGDGGVDVLKGYFVIKYLVGTV